jgi:flagellar P-ring protein precursor FlgI
VLARLRVSTPGIESHLRASALALSFVALGALALPGAAQAVRVKDIASVKGVRSNQLVGYGLVVGLAGSGDKQGTEFTVQSLASVLGAMGIGVDAQAIQVKNVAAVMVTAELTPFARTGATLDATVSSLGDATSLEGGTLVMTPMRGADGQIYALAQGPVSTGGFNVSGGAGGGAQKNHTTVGRVVGGASVERELPFAIEHDSSFQLTLHQADFTTALRVSEAINRAVGSEVASPPDPGTVRVNVPAERASSVVAFLAAVEAVEVEPDAVARVVVNERTGTVVIGANVRIGTVAIAHGALSVVVSAFNDVSQPAPFSDGETTPVRNEAIDVEEEEAQLHVVPTGVTIDELARGLNAMGVSPRDLIAILQAIKASGAMSAELEVL